MCASLEFGWSKFKLAVRNPPTPRSEDEDWDRAQDLPQQLLWSLPLDGRWSASGESDGSHFRVKRESGGQINTVHLKEKKKLFGRLLSGNVFAGWRRNTSFAPFREALKASFPCVVKWAFHPRMELHLLCMLHAGWVRACRWVQ